VGSEAAAAAMERSTRRLVQAAISRYVDTNAPFPVMGRVRLYTARAALLLTSPSCRGLQ
jgi:hypothetical protein